MAGFYGFFCNKGQKYKVLVKNEFVVDSFNRQLSDIIDDLRIV